VCCVALVLSELFSICSPSAFVTGQLVAAIAEKIYRGFAVVFIGSLLEVCKVVFVCCATLSGSIGPWDVVAVVLLEDSSGAPVNGGFLFV
jgi:hypothetical protein